MWQILTRLVLLPAAHLGDMARSAGSKGVACLESELDIFVLQCTFIILELFVLKP